MESSEELARRLVAGLEKLPDRSGEPGVAEAAQSFAASADTLNQQLAAMPKQMRKLLHTADSGFPSSGEWVDQAIEKQNQQINKLARAARMVAAWHGPDGKDAEHIFLIRGNIRGWAHRWRTEDKGPAQVDTDPAFFDFAKNCLTNAGIEDDHEAMIAKALSADWRTAPH